jgi:predicted nucleic acid-binding protein
MLVLDASVVLPACGAPDGFDLFGKEELYAPALLWSEVRSALHDAMWRRHVSEEQATRSLDALKHAPVTARAPRRLGQAAWRIADRLGLAKTYDAEYLALGELLRCRVVTLDARLLRGAAPLGYVVGPADL